MSCKAKMNKKALVDNLGEASTVGSILLLTSNYHIGNFKENMSSCHILLELSRFHKW